MVVEAAVDEAASVSVALGLLPVAKLGILPSEISVIRGMPVKYGNPNMESATFRKWLADRGCRFDHENEKRGEGPVKVVVHHEGRKAEVALGGSHQILDTRVVLRVCEELGLDYSELPGPKSGV